MPKLWVGYACGIAFEPFIAQYVDPYFSAVEDECLNAKLVKDFGAEEIPAGQYEVYERGAYPDIPFDHTGFQTLAPFTASLVGLKQGVPDDVSIMFYAVNSAKPRRRSDGIVTITDTVETAFDWEE